MINQTIAQKRTYSTNALEEAIELLDTKGKFKFAKDKAPINPLERELRGAHTYRETAQDAGDGLVYWIADDDEDIKITAKPYRYKN